MKKINKGIVAKFLYSATCAFLIFFTFGCNPKDEVTSLWDSKNFGDQPAPVIDSIGALNGASAQLAGVGQLRIYGKNFSADKSLNTVQFNDKQGTVLTSTPNSIDVQVPYLAKDTIMVRVAVFKAVSYSNQKIWPLKDPLFTLSTDKFQSPRSLTPDVQGNIYASLVNETGVKQGIGKFDPTTGKYVSFLNATTMPVAYWNGMKFGSDGSLYVVGSQRRVAVIPPTGTAVNSFATFLASDGVTGLNDLDFDINKNIWTGGNTTSNKIFSVSPSKVITGFPFVGLVRAMRVYNGYLYVAARRDAEDKIYRMQINSATSLGAEEVYFDLTGKVTSGTQVTSITFSADGYLYASLSANPGIIVISPNAASFESFYPSVLSPASVSVRYSGLTWDNGNYIYAIQDKLDAAGAVTSTALIKINALKTGAPYYGLK